MKRAKVDNKSFNMIQSKKDNTENDKLICLLGACIRKTDVNVEMFGGRRVRLSH